jgi:phage-related protein
MDVVILDTCKKDLSTFPAEIIEDLLDAVAKLAGGQRLEMPLSKLMQGIGSHVHELRFKDRQGQYRAIYFVKKRDAIYFVHAFRKKTRKTPKKNIDLAVKRIRRLR